MLCGVTLGAQGSGSGSGSDLGLRQRRDHILHEIKLKQTQKTFITYSTIPCGATFLGPKLYKRRELDFYIVLSRNTIEKLKCFTFALTNANFSCIFQCHFNLIPLAHSHKLFYQHKSICECDRERVGGDKTDTDHTVIMNNILTFCHNFRARALHHQSVSGLNHYSNESSFRAKNDSAWSCSSLCYD